MVRAHAAWFVALLPGIVLSGEPQHIDRAKSIFRGSKSAYALWPPEHLAGPGVLWAHWSASGKSLLGVQRIRKVTAESVRCTLLEIPLPGPRPEQTTVFGWDSEDRETVPLWQSFEPVDVGEFDWIGRSEVGLSLVRSTFPGPDSEPVAKYSLLLADNSRRKARVLLQWSGEGADGKVQVVTMPEMPYALLLIYGEWTSGPGRQGRMGPISVVIVQKDGRMGAPMALPPEIRTCLTFYDRATSRCYLRGFAGTRLEGEKDVPIRVWFILAAAANRIDKCVEPGLSVTRGVGVPPEDNGELRIRSDRLRTTNGATRVRLEPHWIVAEGAPEKKGSPTAAMVAADCDDAEIGADAHGVAFIVSGHLFVRRIQHLSLEDFEAAAALECRMATMKTAKAVGLATLMYSTDNEDDLPSKDEFEASVRPYLPDPTDLDGFVYTFGGGNSLAVEDPSTTELGHMEGEGGRAVVYVDGSVRWIANRT